MSDSKDLQIKEKQALSGVAEQTRPGTVFAPAVDVFESEREITLLVDMPGVAGDGIDIDLTEGVLTISGEVKPWENKDECDVLIEFEIGKYYRQFTLSEAIDQAKIQAKLEDGVLRLLMPKAQKAMPRKIAVAAS